MGRKKTGVFITILVVFALLVFGLGLYTRYLASKSTTKKQDEVLHSRLIEVAQMNDLTIYWVGNLPGELNFLEGRIKVIKAGTLSEENMPVKSSEFHLQNYDEDGRLISEQIPVKYTKNLIIIINNEPMLSENDLNIISNCVIQNKVPILTIGGTSIAKIKEHFMQVNKGYEEYDSYFYSMKDGANSHVLDNGELVKDSKKYCSEILRFVIDYYGEGLKNK